jgi:carbonic anhydrase
MDFYKQLFENNKTWVTNRLNEEPDYFEKLAKGQKPPLLYIGCSDSRIPPNEMTGTLPGEVFVHRNIANVIVHTDMNMLSVVDYAVNVLEVNHIVVAGHYGCGGVKASMGNLQHGIIDNWLRHIKDVYRMHRHELDAITDEQLRFDRLVELNVIEQVFNMGKTTIVQNAWQKRNAPHVHGWVIDIKTGLIKDLGVSFNDNDHLPEIFQLEGISLH